MGNYFPFIYCTRARNRKKLWLPFSYFVGRSNNYGLPFLIFELPNIYYLLVLLVFSAIETLVRVSVDAVLFLKLKASLYCHSRPLDGHKYAHALGSRKGKCKNTNVHELTLRHIIHKLCCS